MRAITVLPGVANSAKADRDWLARMISRRVALDHWQEALEYRRGDIKVVLDFTL